MPRTPLNRQIVADIVALIESGELPFGAKLPSQQELAARYDASDTPVKAALRELQLAATSRAHRAAGTT
jgi:GntR family transcriptional repressor for pyruvate dehydrogenase complex